jgi:pimeloyl-ACP methyl ester carboxylesterase
MRDVTEGELSTGQPYLAVGDGPPLVVASSLSGRHANPSGIRRRMTLAWAAPFAEHFRVHLVNRRPGLAPGTTISDLAADYATAIERDLGGRAMVHGTSLGGEVALQLAIDRPDLVSRLVVAAAACRLAPAACLEQAQLLQLVEQGHGRRATARLLASAVPGPLSHLAGAAGWLAGSLAADVRSDLVIGLAAELAFDAEPALGRARAPTLVLGGTRDTYYTEELFRRTAEGMPDGRAVILSGKSHGYVGGSEEAAGIALDFLLEGGAGRGARP